MASYALTEVQLEAVKGSGELYEVGSIDPFVNVVEEDIETECGLIRVAVQGDRRRRALFTYHDIGTNYRTCFRGLFAHPEMQPVVNYFCVYHINAPGHVAESVAFSEHNLHNENGPSYPPLELLAKTIGAVAKHYEVAHFIGLGVGVGANLFCRFHMAHPDIVDALVLLNADVMQAGWIEWGWFKIHNLAIKRTDHYQTVVEYLGWHWFGEIIQPADRPHDLVLKYMEALKHMKRESVIGLVTSFVHRSEVHLSREHHTLKCPSLLITGDSSPHIDAVVETNSRLDPTLNDFLKLADCGGVILDEAPGKVSEALRLFLQGLGCFPALRGHVKEPEPETSVEAHNLPHDDWPSTSTSYSVSTGMI